MINLPQINYAPEENTAFRSHACKGCKTDSSKNFKKLPAGYAETAAVGKPEKAQVFKKLKNLKLLIT